MAPTSYEATNTGWDGRATGYYFNLPWLDWRIATEQRWTLQSYYYSYKTFLKSAVRRGRRCLGCQKPKETWNSKKEKNKKKLRFDCWSKCMYREFLFTLFTYDCGAVHALSVFLLQSPHSAASSLWPVPSDWTSPSESGSHLGAKSVIPMPLWDINSCVSGAQVNS